MDTYIFLSSIFDYMRVPRLIIMPREYDNGLVLVSSYACVLTYAEKYYASNYTPKESRAHDSHGFKSQQSLWILIPIMKLLIEYF